MSNACVSVSTNEYPSILPSCPSDITTCSRLTGHISNCSSTQTSLDIKCPPKTYKKLNFEKFKKILQTPSSKTGDNLYDQLVEIIKRIIDDRPRNVADYFEQYSRHVRRNKLPLELVDPQFLFFAENFMEFLKPTECFGYMEEYEETEINPCHSTDWTNERVERPLADNENTIQIQHFFSFCSLGFNIDEVYHLSLAILKVQYHPQVKNARFWGRMYGINGSYFIVEADLSQCEIQKRAKEYKNKLLEDMKSFIIRKDRQCSDIEDDSLIPGFGWQTYPEEDLKRMQCHTEPVPKLHFDEVFDVPLEEPSGTGLNRKTYFVTTSLNGEWQELRNVAAKHIVASRKIKKFLTGDLNTDFRPQFPGFEESYLRAMIARITAGTFIAPKGYYRKKTRKDKRPFCDGPDLLEELRIELDDEGEEEEPNNDVLIMRNEEYVPFALDDLARVRNWVHARPNILNQGRILDLNEELFLKNLEARARKLLAGETEIIEEMVCDEMNEMIEEEPCVEEEEEPDICYFPEVGPALFSECSLDRNKEGIPSWTTRYSSVYYKPNQMVIVRSNLWPGAYAIDYEGYSDCIYFGWGCKYVARCFSLEQLPPIQNFDFPDVAFEINDPTVEMERAWKNYHKKKEICVYYGEEQSDISIEYDLDSASDIC